MGGGLAAEQTTGALHPSVASPCLDELAYRKNSPLARKNIHIKLD